MSLLHNLLDDVLSGRKVISDRAAFDQLRQSFPDKANELNRLEGDAIARRSEHFITSVERLRRELDQPGSSSAQPSASTTPSAQLTRVDLEDILKKRRSPTMAEIDWFLTHAKEYELRLSTSEEYELRQLAARMQAQARLATVVNQAQSEEFIARVVHTYRTAYGDLTQAEVDQLESIRTKAEQAIRSCKDHQKERCRCWSAAREMLFNLRQKVSDRSPLGISALALWNTIEALARNRNVESQTSPPMTEPAPGIIYNWRHFKSPEYVNEVLRR